MKTIFLTLILALASFSYVSQAIVIDYELLQGLSFDQPKIEMRTSELDATTLLGFFESLEKIMAQIFSLKENNPKETQSPFRMIEMFSNIETSEACDACMKAVDAARNFTDKDALKKILEKEALDVCKKHLNESVCQDAITRYGDVVFAALMNRTFEAQNVCAKLYLCEKKDHKEVLKDYVNEVLKDKPAFNVPTPTKKSSYTILHLTDPHIDLDYEAGTNSVCDLPLCCRPSNGPADNSSVSAGYWGTHSSCDLPLRTFDQFLQFASSNFEVDMIIWTGDNIAHNIWEQSADNQTVNTYDATQHIMQYFPKTAIYPMFGNHEAFPCDEFDFLGNNSIWLTEQLADMWKVWLDEDAINTFRNHSYYSIVNPDHNVKIIALDTVACDSNDFYLIEDPTDPQDQLAWLRTELYDSESKNQPVFLMGHIPPGNFGCDSEWSARYRAIIDRFTNIIRGQFFGHTHDDEFEIVRSYADNSPVGVVYIAPSLTTYSNLNPSFRIFEIDTDTSVPINYFQYRLDLPKWNQNTTGPIQWDLAYDALSEYGLSDMSYSSFMNLAEKIKDDMNVTQLYKYNMYSGTGSPNATIDPKDVAHLYCGSANSVSSKAFECLGFNATTGDLMDMAQQLLPGYWKFGEC